jgi:hypothetical protein
LAFGFVNFSNLSSIDQPLEKRAEHDGKAIARTLRRVAAMALPGFAARKREP